MLRHIKKQYQKRIKWFIPRWVFWCKDKGIIFYRKVFFWFGGFWRKGVYGDKSAQNLSKFENYGLISIVILSFERGKQTKNTIESILRYTKNINKEIIIWDNASKDSLTLKVLQKVNKRKDTRVIFSDKNLRCGGSRKEVIKLVKGDYVLFLDNDIEVTTGTAEALILRLDESSDYMGACCRVVFPDHSVQLNGGSMIRDGQFVSFGLIDSGKMENNSSTMVKRECDWIPGGATMFKREIFDKVDFDTGYPNTYEDTDLSMQITQKLGKKVVNCPEAKVIHHHIDYELLKDKGTKKYQGTRYNKEMFIKSWLHFYHKWNLVIRDDFIFSLIDLRGKSDDDIMKYIKQKTK